MNKTTKIFFILTLLFNNSFIFSQVYEDLDQEIYTGLDHIGKTESDIRKEEKFIQSNIKNVNPDLGIVDQEIITRNDKSQINMSYLFNHEFGNFSSMQGFEFGYYKKINSITPLWWGIDFRQFNLLYEAIGDNRSPSLSSHPDSESQNKKLEDDPLMLQSFGLGLAYRFRLFLDYLNLSSRIFETVKFNITLNSLYDVEREWTYQGAGTSVEYNLIHRSNESFYYAFKLGYNLATLQRAQESDEDEIDRSISLGFLNLGLEIGYFYQ